MSENENSAQTEIRLATLEGEISALKSAMEKNESPWNAAVVISLIALLFSIGTTLFSYLQEKDRYIHDTRAELRSLVQRLDRIPVENIEYFKKYENDNMTAQNISSALNAENALVAKQAYEIMNLIPDHVEPTEYLTVASALQNSYLLDLAAKMYEAGIGAANDVNDEIGLRRSYANLEFLIGNPDAGRSQFREALNVFSKFPTNSSYVVEYTNFLTEAFWSVAEASIRQCKNSKDHLAAAESHLASLAALGVQTQQYGQIEAARKAADGCIPA